MVAKEMTRPWLEQETFCVLDRCDNQLRHRALNRRADSTISLLLGSDALMIGKGRKY